MPLNDESLTLDFEFRELKPQILTKQTYHTQVMVRALPACLFAPDIVQQFAGDP